MYFHNKTSGSLLSNSGKLLRTKNSTTRNRDKLSLHAGTPMTFITSIRTSLKWNELDLLTWNNRNNKYILVSQQELKNRTNYLTLKSFKQKSEFQPQTKATSQASDYSQFPLKHFTAILPLKNCSNFNRISPDLWVNERNNQAKKNACQVQPTSPKPTKNTGESLGWKL